MRVVLVLTQPPLAEGGAPGKTAIGLLRGLQGHGVDVRALAARRHFTVTGDVPPGLPVEIVDVEPPGPWRARLQRVRRPVGELAGGSFAAAVHDAAGDADVVHLEETETAWCDEGLETPSLVHVHYLARSDRSLGLPWQRQFREVLDRARAERAAVRRHRYLVASSPVVADELRRVAPGAEVVVAPLSLDPALYEPARLDGPPTAGLIGTAAWAPTAQAMRTLLEDVWPLVRREVPGARLVLAGRGTERLGLSPARDVELAGEVASARDLFQRLSVLLFPLERGSGMKVKVLESLASGVPVVTTAAGAEGIGPSAGVSVHESPEALAAAASEVLASEAERRERGAAARAEFERRFTPGPATEPLVELYRHMAS
ncbi:MAG TPA: glycosyltransferase family 4 protein [Gaiellaceae bacterium]|nr:glycosyltransferase family 4 protein [Gaiellaceae bacterium]